MSKDGRQRIFVCCSLLVLKALFNERLELGVEKHREMTVQHCTDLQVVGGKRRAEELREPIFKVTKVATHSSPVARSAATQSSNHIQPNPPAAISTISPSVPVPPPVATESVHASPIEPLTPPAAEPVESGQQSPVVAETEAVEVEDVSAVEPVIMLPSLSPVVDSAERNARYSVQLTAPAPVLPAIAEQLVPRLNIKYPPPRCRPRNSLRQGKVTTFEVLIIEKELKMMRTPPVNTFSANYFRAISE